MFSPHMCTIIVVKSCEILEKLASDDDHAIEYFIDERMTRLDLESIVTNLYALLQNPISTHNVRRPAIRALLEICKFEVGLVKKAVLTIKGVSLVLPLLDDPDSQIREIAIMLLYLFSQHEPDGVVEYLLKPRRLEALVGFLEIDGKDDVKMAAAGLLANLPKSEKPLTMKLIELEGHTALINILKTGSMEAKENALSALFRFTDPENIESQRIVVEADVYPFLVNFLKVSSIPAKARAAALIGNLSASTLLLTVESNLGFCWCFRPSGAPLCSAHGCICTVKSSFCLLEANALPDLVKLLHGEVHETAYEAIQALSTLVNEGFPKRGAYVLHENNAINPIIEILNWGTVSLKEEALGLLEKVFGSKEMVEKYGSSARFRLVGLTGGSIHADGRLTRKAAKILTLMEGYSRSSTSILPGLHQ